MIFKVIGQFLLATSVLQMMPVDAAYFEWQAGVTDNMEVGDLYATEVPGFFATLPQADSRFDYPTKIDTDSYGIVTTAQSAIVIDRDTDVVLFQKHPDAVRSIGSVTKLMSALVFLEQSPDLSQTVTLNPEQDYIAGGRVYLGYFNGVALRDVLAASLIGSDNTATQSLVRFSGLALDDFVARMNLKAEELEMGSTVFVDPTGISADNMSTARDLVKLLEEAEKSETIKYYTELPSVIIGQESSRTIEIENTNSLLTCFLNEGDFDVVGGKTGYLPQAGYVLATTVEENNHAVHVVVLGAESKDARISEAKGLVYWAFKTFEWK